LTCKGLVKKLAYVRTYQKTVKAGILNSSPLPIEYLLLEQFLWVLRKRLEPFQR